MLNLLFNLNGLKFQNVYVFWDSLYHEKYKILDKLLLGLPEINCYEYSEHDKIIHPNKARTYFVIIFDGDMWWTAN